MPCRYNREDLEAMARAWVDRNIDTVPGSEHYLIWVERVTKDLIEQLDVTFLDLERP